MRARFNVLSESVARGRAGLNVGLTFKMKKFERFVPGLIRKSFTLVTGLSGSGKTSFVLDKLFIEALETAKNNNIDVRGKFYSFEMDVEAILAKIVSRKIFTDYRKVIPVSKILSRSKENVLTSEEEILVNSYQKYWKWFEDRMLHQLK
jgi:KaiC/GvpD/RAD55 family RecA-like ATPase